MSAAHAAAAASLQSARDEAARLKLQQSLKQVKIEEYAKKFNPGVPQEKRLIRTIQAWSNVLALWEAMKRADKAGTLTGETILMKGFRTMKEFELGLGGASLTYTDTDHRISGKVPVYEYKNGKFQRVTVVDLKGRWPDKWQSWLGW